MIRALGVDDLEALTALENRSQPIPWSDDQLLLELVNDDAVVLGVLDPVDGLVAHTCLRVIVDELWVLNIAVDPRARRKRLAWSLLERGLHRAAEAACTSMWLEVRESNAGARALYKRFGFEEKGRRPGYYPPLPPAASREAAILMSRPVTGLAASAGRRAG